MSSMFATAIGLAAALMLLPRVTRGYPFCPVQDFPCDCSAGTLCDTGDFCSLGGCVEIGGTTYCMPGLGFPMNEGAVCSGNACVGTYACHNGFCAPNAPPLDCDDGNPCTQNVCDPPAGCQYPAKAGSCDDGNVCTVGDTCQGGSCASGGPLNCDDGNPCTDDGCAGGCYHTFNTAPCSDGNVCTTGDVCSAGVCGGGTCDLGERCPLGCEQGYCGRTGTTCSCGSQLPPEIWFPPVLGLMLEDTPPSTTTTTTTLP